jgi:hypothetical protein
MDGLASDKSSSSSEDPQSARGSPTQTKALKVATKDKHGERKTRPTAVLRTKLIQSGTVAALTSPA